ncbi:MAG TPA: hypothetical protein VFH78_00710, partial [Candidatus Thermoplasmatota archaeon]|nr:hypothetical protein [Candidatus Thermoplasmatota archaeon]
MLLDYALLLTSLLAFAAGPFVAWIGRRNLLALFVGLLVSLAGINALLVPLFTVFGLPLDLILAAAVTAGALCSGTMAGFGIIYPRMALGVAHRVALVGVALAAAGTSAYAFAARSSFVAGGGITDAFWSLILLVFGVGFAVGVIALAWRWLATPPGPYRTRTAWALVPVLWLNLSDALGFHVYPLIFEPRRALALDAPPLGLAATLLAFLIVAGAIALVAYTLLRSLAGRASADERAVGLVLLALSPLTLLQVLAPEFGTPAPPVTHMLIDVLFVFAVVYAVIRYNVVDLDLKLKWTIGRSTIAGIFVALFFVASESAAVFLGERLGTYVGIASAGLLLFALAPLQRFAEQVSDRAMPRVHDTEDYRLVRRREAYAAAVEAALTDGEITEKERDILAAMADSLG